jgi:hypothetical protein
MPCMAYASFMHTEALRAKLMDHEIIQRLMNNPNWKPAAMAAVAFLVDGKKCPVPSWRRSSTWAQVQMVFDELNQSNSGSKQLKTT